MPACPALPLPESPIETQTPTVIASASYVQISAQTRSRTLARARMPADHKQRAPFYLWPWQQQQTPLFTPPSQSIAPVRAVNAEAAEKRDGRARDGRRKKGKRLKSACWCLNSDLALKVFLAMFCNHKLTKCINCFVCFYCATKLDVQCRRRSWNTRAGAAAASPFPLLGQLEFYDPNFRWKLKFWISYCSRFLLFPNWLNCFSLWFIRRVFLYTLYIYMYTVWRWSAIKMAIKCVSHLS